MATVAGPTLSVVLPAYNEAANLGAVLVDVLRYLDARPSGGEVVVVDDGSSDGTTSLLSGWARGEPRLRIVRHAVNAGYGAALRSGLERARGEHVCVMDADRQFHARDIRRLEAWTGAFDVVIGYRAPRRDSWARVANGRGWNVLVNACLRLGVRDVDCALKLFHRRALQGRPLRSTGAFVSSELLARARAGGFRIKEVPVAHFPRGAGRPTGMSPGVVARACLELVTLGPELRRAGQMKPSASASAVS